MAEESSKTTIVNQTSPTKGHSDRTESSRRPRDGARQNEDKQFDERTLHIDRVARVVMGGRRFRFRALVVVGDHKGNVGVGLSKGADVSTAVAKASNVAKKKLLRVPIYKGTLPHEVMTKVGGAKILLKPASTGTGLIAGGAVRSVLEVAGVTDALSKSLGSTNQVNIAYATIEALSQLAPAKSWTTSKANSKKADSIKLKVEK